MRRRALAAGFGPLLVMILLSGCNSAARGPAPDRAATAQLTRLRIAIDAPQTAPCAADGLQWPAPQRAYVRHLGNRMGIAVTLCPMASRQDAAAALATGKIDMALLDAESYAAVKTSVRPILARRQPADLGRVEAALIVTQGSALRQLAASGQSRPIFMAQNPVVLAGVRQTMASVWAPALANSTTVISATTPAAMAALRSGAGDVVVLQSAQWVRFCRGQTKGDTPCTDLREIWRGRPPAAEAWSVRRDMPKESWARLVGIHLALFDEQPLIAQWLAPGATEIEPTEATALEIAR